MYAQIGFPQAKEAALVNDTTVFVGLDVHKDSITVACVGADSSDTPQIDFRHSRHSAVRDRSADQRALRPRPFAVRLRSRAPVASGCSGLCVRSEDRSALLPLRRLIPRRPGQAHQDRSARCAQSRPGIACRHI